MPRPLALLTLPLAALLLPGCIVRTAVDVVTLPVRAVGAGVDAVTTSQSEADEKRGRQIRRREEKLGRLERQHDKLAARCARGEADACAAAVEVRAEIDELLPTVPYERQD